MHDIRVGFITFIVAFCSVVYELLLSSIASVLLGGTFYRFLITIGLYIFCLGMGSLFFDRIKEKKLDQQLIRVEAILSFLGSICLILPLLLELMVQNGGLFEYRSLIIETTVYALIIGIGFFSGLELPLVMALAEKEKSKSSSNILAIDFIATFLGIVVFPIFLLPQLGLFNCLAFIVTLNLFIIVYFMKRDPAERRTPTIIFSLITFAILLFNTIAGMSLTELVF